MPLEFRETQPSPELRAKVGGEGGIRTNSASLWRYAAAQQKAPAATNLGPDSSAGWMKCAHRRAHQRWDAVRFLGVSTTSGERRSEPAIGTSINNAQKYS